MSDKRDYYEVLGVNKEASEAEIKKAFKKEKKSRDEEETYKNGLLNINEELNNNKYIDYELINSSKNKEFKMLDDYLQDKNVKVFYIQGTLHYDLYQKYSNVIDELLRIKWWNYNYSDLPDNNKCDDINYFVEEMNRLISNGNIQERDYKKFNLSEVFRGL